MDILAWIFGAGAMASLVVMNQVKKREGMLAAKLSADVFWGAQYLCLGAIGGMIPNIVGIFRELVYMNRKKHKWASSPLWPALFVTVIFLLGLRSFTPTQQDRSPDAALHQRPCANAGSDRYPCKR